MGVASRAVAKHVGYHHTPVAGERLVRRAGSMYDKNELRLVTKMALLCLLDGPSSHGVVRHLERVVLYNSIINGCEGAYNEVAVGKNIR